MEVRPTRGEIVAEAKKWIGKPWVHGVYDCAQLVINVGKGCNAFRSGALEDPCMDEFIGYPRNPIPKKMLKALNILMEKVEQPQLGDVCFFYIQGAPSHLGIVSRPPGKQLYVIHAFNKPNIDRVVESRVINRNHILGVWQYPNIKE